VIRHLATRELADLLTRIFERHGVSETSAAILGQNCAGCERDGSISHGVFRIAGYCSSLNSGWVNGRAVPVVEDVAPAYLRVDADNGFAQPALEAARVAALAKVRANGVAVVAIRNSHHFSAIWPDVEPFAEEGLIALSVVNSFAISVPHGAKQPVFGTNPIALSVPCNGSLPITFDMATSAMAHGDVMIAAREGHEVPAGSGVDRDGNPTTDPKAILDGGALVPFGGHKGSAISMMIELLAAGLTGGNYSFEFDMAAHPGAMTPHTGQLVVLIDSSLAGGRPFHLRAEDLIRRMEEAGLTRLPGARRYRNRSEAEMKGIPLAEATLIQLEELAH
jgi:delta1-piperideine-2-carboxylate reductase